jgi:tetratricopeptide (TPR) repeat protein
LPDETIPADPMLGDGEYKNYLAAKQDLSDGRRALKQGDLEAALACEKVAEQDNPGFYQNSWLLADVLFRQGKYPEAVAACQRALAEKPALGGEKQRIEKLLTEAEAHK